MVHLEKQQTLILIVGAFVLAGFGMFRYAPILRQKLSLKEEMNKHSLAIEQIGDQGSLLPEMELKKQKMQDQQDEFRSKIPVGRGFSKLWQQIADVMNDCQLSDQLVQPGTEIKSDELCCIPLAIECTGTFEQIYALFQSLESMDRLICIDEVKIENDSEFKAILKLNAKANVYYQPPAADNG